MKRTLFLLTVVVLFAVFAMAQTSSSTSSSTTANPSASSSSTMSNPQSDTSSQSGQSGSSMSQSSASTSSGNSLDGCIVKDGSDYYIQPTDGGARVKLSTSEDLSAHVGHHVKVTGTPSAASSNMGGSASSSSGASGSNASETFNVTKIDMVSTSCPASK